MRMLFVLLVAALALGGCGQTIQDLQGVYSTITTTTVPPGYANIAINSFDALKATSTNYARYCIGAKFPQPTCSAANRRAVIRFVRSGTAARNALEANIATSQPLLSTTYNVLVAAINGLKQTPVQTVQAGS